MDENEKPKRKHSLWMSSAVTVAIITSGSSLLKSYWNRQDSSKDMQDSYKAVAQAVNTLQVDMGEMKGRLEEIEKLHEREARNTEGKKPSGKVLQLGEISVAGHVGDSGSSGVASSAATALPDSPPMAVDAVLAPPASKALPASLDAALAQERAPKK